VVRGSDFFGVRSLTALQCRPRPAEALVFTLESALRRVRLKPSSAFRYP